MKKMILLMTMILLVTGCKKEEKEKIDTIEFRFSIGSPIELKFKNDEIEKANIRGICKIEKTTSEEIKNNLNETITNNILEEVNEDIKTLNSLEELSNKTSEIGKRVTDKLNEQNIKTDYCAVVIEKN